MTTSPTTAVQWVDAVVTLLLGIVVGCRLYYGWGK